jgi:SPX domain protein involved in polyphosphate accumulation
MDHVSLLKLTAKNQVFLELYEPYIVKEWKTKYFNYDELKQEYKALKKVAHPNVRRFDSWFYEEISSVDTFLQLSLNEIGQDLDTVGSTESNNHTMELFLRSIFEKCHRSKRFFDLNFYVICKTAKKFEKILQLHQTMNCTEDDAELCTSITFLHRNFTQHKEDIRMLISRCVDLYSQKFRSTYPALTFGELKYVKNKTREHSKTKFYIGVKLGLVFMMVSYPPQFTTPLFVEAQKH